MIEFKNTAIIKRPLPEVFAYVNDFDNMPNWFAAWQPTNNLVNDSAFTEE